ncbi:MAG TPA: hypothetical protein VGD78_14005 [Chthoniobacterales bacterium]
MNSLSRIHAAAPVRINGPSVQPNLDKVECQFCKVSALLAFYNELQSLCCIVLVLTGAGTLLYSAGLLLWVCLRKGS